MFDDQLFPVTAYFAYFLIFTLCIVYQQLYANFPHPSYEDIQQSLMFKQVTQPFNAMFFSFLMYFFTAYFTLRGVLFPWQVLLYLLARTAETHSPQRHLSHGHLLVPSARVTSWPTAAPSTLISGSFPGTKAWLKTLPLPPKQDGCMKTAYWNPSLDHWTPKLCLRIA